MSSGRARAKIYLIKERASEVLRFSEPKVKERRRYCGFPPASSFCALAVKILAAALIAKNVQIVLKLV